MTLFLGGDVMTGRGVDQILSHPSSPDLHEPVVQDAREYVRLAERVSGAVPRTVDSAYIWGDAAAELTRMAPDLRVANLETAVTRSDEYDADKGIHYRMHPDNVGCLTSARLEACVLANNHVLDYGRPGLFETLTTLKQAGIGTVGAGGNLDEAARPLVLPVPRGERLIIGAYAHESSGVRDEWAAAADDAGVNVLPDLSMGTAAAVAAQTTDDKRPGDVAMISIHWGDNWGYEVPREHVEFARRLVDGGVDLVYGHSSHHPRPMEVYRGRLILYGCGDLIDDYEGISGYERYRDDLVLMFFPTVDPATGALVTLQMSPMRIRRLRLNHASLDDSRWLCETLNRVSGTSGAGVDLRAEGTFVLVTERGR